MARILIIDDDPIFRATVRRALDRGDDEVFEARGGDEGIEYCGEGGADLVICDIIMPGKDGIETIQILRKQWPEVRILAVSGGSRLDPTERLTDAELLGADASLAKPFTIAELREKVSGLVGPP